MNENIWALAAVGVVLGISGLLSTRRGWRVIGAPIAGMLIMSILANMGAVPRGVDGPALYADSLVVLGPAAMFLMVLETRLRDIAAAGPALLLLFAAGAVGIMAGALLAALLFGNSSILGDRVAPLAGMLVAGFTGGTVNFNAIGVHYGLAADARFFATAVAIENVVKGCWILVTALAPALIAARREPVDVPKDVGSWNENPQRAGSATETRMSFGRLLGLVLLTIAAFWSAGVLARLLQSFGLNVPSVLILTTMGLALGHTRLCRFFAGAAKLGRWAISVFLIVLGAHIDVRIIWELASQGLAMLQLAAIMLLVHSVFLLVAMCVLRTSAAAAGVVSSAAIGGVSSVTALVATYRRDDLLAPGLLMAAIGNATGTYLGFLIVAAL